MAEYGLFYLSSRHGSSSNCTKCGNILNFGMWGLGVIAQGTRYTLGTTPAPVCCDIEQPAMALYANKEEAQQARKTIEQAFAEGTQDTLTWFQGYPTNMDIVKELV